MNKRRKSSFSDSGESGDLADVNEQELAKDGEGSGVFSGSKEHGTDDKSSDNNSQEKMSREPEEKNEKNCESSDADGDFIIVNVEPDADKELLTPVESDGEKSVVKREGIDVPQRTDCADIVVEDEKNGDGDTKAADGADGGDGEENQEERDFSPKRRRKTGLVYIAIIILCLAASIGVLVFSATTDDIYVVETTELTESETQTEGEEENTSALSVSGELGAEEIYELGVKATVSVKGEGAYYSGVAVFGDGYIATLYEAVDGAENIEITLWDGSVYPAELVGGNSTVNLALLKTEAKGLEYVSVGSSEELAVGNAVYAIGNVGEGKYSSSLIACRVSFSRRVLELVGYDGTQRRAVAIQINGLQDGALKGCPVFNAYGEAVAMTLTCESGSSAGFALPLDIAAEILSVIRFGGEPSEELLARLAFLPASLGIIGEQAQAGELFGVSVKGFADDSSDAAAKLREGDLIFRINDTLIPDTVTLKSELEKLTPGVSVEVFVYRQEQRLSFFVVLS